MKILIATDAYFPQVNGVVRTLHETGKILKEQGHRIEYITPELFLTFTLKMLGKKDLINKAKKLTMDKCKKSNFNNCKNL